MIKKRWLRMSLHLLLLSFSAPAAQFHVAPCGDPGGDGSTGSPWDLQTALSHPPRVSPGDTVYLHGGLYVGTFSSTLAVGYVVTGPSQNLMIHDNYIMGGTSTFNIAGFQTAQITGKTVFSEDWGGGLLMFDEAPRYDSNNILIGQGWRQWTGFDTNSIYSYDVPHGSTVLLFPNDHEPGRDDHLD